MNLIRWVLTIVLLSGTWQVSIGQKAFTLYINPGGWPVPTLTKEVVTDGVHQMSANFISKRYESIGNIFLPRFYVDGDGALIASSISFDTKEVTVSVSKGCIYAYDAVMRGVQVGIIAHARWEDMDGHGVFTRLRWGSGKDDMPAWLNHVPPSDCKLATTLPKPK